MKGLKRFYFEKFNYIKDDCRKVNTLLSAETCLTNKQIVKMLEKSFNLKLSFVSMDKYRIYYDVVANTKRTYLLTINRF